MTMICVIMRENGVTASRRPRATCLYSRGIVDIARPDMAEEAHLPHAGRHTTSESEALMLKLQTTHVGGNVD